MIRCLDCGKSASYGFEKTDQNPYPKKTHCLKHRKEDMINLSYSKCQECNCRNAAYRYPDQEKSKMKRYCFSHKKSGMVDIMSPKCIECDITASYGLPNEKRPIYCGKHKKPNTVNRRLRPPKKRKQNKKLTIAPISFPEFNDRNSRLDTIRTVVELESKKLNTVDVFQLDLETDYTRKEEDIVQNSITSDNNRTEGSVQFEITLREDYIR